MTKKVTFVNKGELLSSYVPRDKNVIRSDYENKFGFSVVDVPAILGKADEYFVINVKIEEELIINWHLDGRSREDLTQILFCHVVEYIRNKIEEGEIPGKELFLTAKDHPEDCPVDVSKIQMEGYSFIVEVKRQIGFVK